MADQLFTHLHVHSEYSLLDGAIRLDDLVDRAKECGMQSIALTDHGNIFGAVKFFDLCKKAGIKPILGNEMYFTDDATVKMADNKYHHLILLVQNEQGYQNLCKLISYAYTTGFYFKPRIDYQILEKYNEGLIATSACLGGQIPSLIINNQLDKAEEHITWFIRVFGRERFYLEVQPEDQPEQTIVNNKLYELAEKYNLTVIATTDAHYLTSEYQQAHEIMLCIQTHQKLTEPDRFTFGNCRPWLRSVPEMLEAFKGREQLLWNTQKIVDLCDFKFQTGKLFFPQYEIPPEHTQESYFQELCTRGFEQLIAQKRIPSDQISFYQDRLTLEINLIIHMGFVGYFLIVSDFIRWAKRNNVPVGPGRGSAAGSLVAWTLEITNLDPIKYNLLFERFLNPERISMPDIDIDFCVEGREKVIQYVRDKYGHDKVCSIITFGTMAAKGVLKDVARVLGLPFEDANAITDLVPDQLKITLQEALEKEPRLQALKDSNPAVTQLFDVAFKLEGITRHASKHAAGVVICPQRVDELLPVYIPPKSDELVTQYAMTELEQLGFLKIDFLGLKNLTLIDRIIRLINKTRTITIEIEDIPLDDAATFKLICAGKTSGVFQLESDGLKDVLRRLSPEKFEDIIAVNALYRPGPLGSGMVDDYIERRHGKQKISYIFPELEPILQETYGVIVYQEQVMKIASAIGGYSLGEADILRRAMGKKKAEVMAQQREIFLQRATKSSFDAKKAGDLFDLMAYFAGYGFNKSHSAAYAKIAYQTAYLKANFLPEFMACLISLEVSDAEKMSFYLQEAKDLGLKILPPDINQSDINFGATENAILFGLQGIKNVGTAALESIVAERTKKPFADVLDFCARVDLRAVNKRVLENLVCAGAFDHLPGNRAQQFAELETIIEQAIEHKKACITGQMGLFAAARHDNTQTPLYAYQPIEDWPMQEKLAKEKEIIGFYLSAHPLDSVSHILKKVATPPIGTLMQNNRQLVNGKEPFVACCGFLKSHRIMFTKKGERMAFAQLEDKTGTTDIVIFPRTFATIEQWLETHHVFLVKGALDITSTSCKIKANLFMPVELWLQQYSDIYGLKITLPAGITVDQIDAIKKTMPKGKTPVTFLYQENGTPLSLHSRFSAKIEQQVTTALEQLGCEMQLVP